MKQARLWTVVARISDASVFLSSMTCMHPWICSSACPGWNAPYACKPKSAFAFVLDVFPSVFVLPMKSNWKHEAISRHTILIKLKELEAADLPCIGSHCTAWTIMTGLTRGGNTLETVSRSCTLFIDSHLYRIPTVPSSALPNPRSQARVLQVSYSPSVPRSYLEQRPDHLQCFATSRRNPSAEQQACGGLRPMIAVTPRAKSQMLRPQGPTCNI